MVTLSSMQEELSSQDRWDFSDLSAFYINTTLKKSPEQSHTQGLMDISAEIVEAVVQTYAALPRAVFVRAADCLHLVTARSPSQQIAKSVAWLKKNFARGYA